MLRTRFAAPPRKDIVIDWLNEPALTVGGYAISWLEVVGDLTGLASVWFAARERVLTWPTGIANSALFLLLFFDARLYLSMGLQIAFIGLGVYGWISWVLGRTSARDELPVRRTTIREWSTFAAVITIGCAALTWAFSTFTDAANPLWDSMVAVISLVATFGQARKLLEFWLLFLVVDLISVPLYWSQGLRPTALVFAVFGVLCVFGFREWLGSYRADVPHPTNAAAGIDRRQPA